MANLLLPDSNIYINAVRSGVDPFAQFTANLEDWEFATCGTIVMEVCRGLSEPTLVERFQDRFNVMVFLPTTNAVWKRATQLAWTLDRKGAVLPIPDLIIAACALQAGATVLTADTHFQVIPGLRVLDRLK
jgi:predicted nucleic acid-binding protein